jgi:protein-disulfide isomerase
MPNRFVSHTFPSYQFPHCAFRNGGTYSKIEADDRSGSAKRMKRYLPFAIIAVVFIAALGSGALLYRARSKPAVALKGEPGAEPPNARGSVGAPVIFEEFGDLQCPPCATLTPIVDQLEKQYGRKLRVLFRHFPLLVHKNAPAAARATEAAGLQGRFWEMQHLLYQTQAAWKDLPNPQQIFEADAAKLGLDVARFKADMQGDKVTARLNADKRRATSLGVDSTPTVFINNQRVKITGITIDAFRAPIDAALQKK